MANINEEARIPVYLNDEQAKSALKNLQGEPDKWRRKMHEAMAGGDMKGMKNAERELKKTQKAANQLKREAFDVNKVLSNISSASVQDLGKAIRKIRKQQAGLNRDTKEYQDLQKKKLAIKDEFKKINGQLPKQQSLLSSLKKSAAGLLPAFGFAAIVLGLKNMFRSAIQTRTEFSRYEAVLSNTLGSQKEANKEFAMLKEFAAKTPFQLNELTGAYVKLTNQGFKPTKKEMSSLGDLASAMGKSFDQLTEAIIDAQVGENERLKEFGIRAQKNGDIIKYTFKGVTTEVDNNAESIKNYILSLGKLDGVQGGMAKISKTIGGALSNQADASDSLFNSIGKRLEPALVKMLGTSTGLLNVLSEWAESKLSDTLKSQQTEVNGLVVELTSANIQEERREEVVKRLNEIAPDLAKTITDEKNNLEDLTEALSAYNNEMALKILIAEGDEDIARQKAKVNSFKELSLQAEAELARQMRSSLSWFEKKAPEVKDKAESILYDTQKTLLQKAEELNRLALDNTSLGNTSLFMALDGFRIFKQHYSDELNSLNLLVSKTGDLRDDWKAIFGSGEVETPPPTTDPAIGSLKTIGNKVYEWDGKTWKFKENVDGGTESGGFEATKAALELAFAQEQNLLKEQLLQKKLSKKQYNDEMYLLEMANLVAMRELYKQHGQDFITIEGQILDKKLAWAQQFDAMMQVSKSVTESLLDEERKMFADIDAEMEKHLDTYQKNLDKETDATIDAENKKREAEKAAYEMKIDNAARAGEMAVENAETIEEAGKAIINSIRQQIRAYMAEAVAIAAMKALKSVPFPFNIAAAVVAGGAATFLFNKIIPEFYDGGPTGPGGKYEPAGVVHKREYVIPSEGTQNPQLRPIIDIMEIARRNGSLARLDMHQILQAIPAKQMYTGGYSSQSEAASAGVTQPYTSDPELKQLIRENIKAARELQKWKPPVAIELIKKGLEQLDDIQQNSGL